MTDKAFEFRTTAALAISPPVEYLDMFSYSRESSPKKLS